MGVEVGAAAGLGGEGVDRFGHDHRRATLGPVFMIGHQPVERARARAAAAAATTG